MTAVATDSIVKEADSTATEAPAAGPSSMFGYITPFNYSRVLASLLLIFAGYLILPRGLRAQYCGFARRRYRRQRRRIRKASHHPSSLLPPPLSRTRAIPRSSPSRGVLDDVCAYSRAFSPRPRKDGEFFGSPATSNPARSTKSGSASTQASAFESVWSGVEESQGCSDIMSQDKQEPSLPQQLRAMLQQPPGIKFRAHGTKCQPRSVWITLHCDNADLPLAAKTEYRNCLTWRAEMKSPSSSPSPNESSPATTAPAKLGNLRKVEMLQVLGIELGKRTTALRRIQTAGGVDENDCFSLLTKTGTLDLECRGIVFAAGQESSAKQVRAAFITCLALAMSSKGLWLNGLQPVASPVTLGSQLRGLDGDSPMTQMTLDENTIFTGLMSENRATSSMSF